MRRLIVTGGIALAALVVVAAAAVAFHNMVAQAIIRSIAAGAGYDVAFARLQVGLGGAVATGTDVRNRAGQPVFRAARIAVRYDLRGFLPGGSKRRFGLADVDVAQPTLTLIHFADGSYNVALPANAAPAKPDTTPLDLRVRVRDGTVAFVDRFSAPGRERQTRIVGLDVDAVLSPHAHSYYAVHLALDDGRGRYPVVGRATFAAERGFESQHWTAAGLPIAGLVDFALPTHAVDVTAGRLRDIDARIYSFVDPDGTTHTHAGVRAQLDAGDAAVTGLTAPVRGAHGTLLVYDDGLTTSGIDAAIAGVPFHVAGGVYGLAAPQVRFVLTGSGELAQLERAIAASQRQPLSGRLTFAAEAIGAATAPRVNGSFSAPALTYRGYRLRNAGGSFSVHGRDLDLLGGHVAYGPLNLAVGGTLALERAVRANLVVSLSGDAGGLPYAAQVLPGLRIAAVAHIDGPATQLSGAGVVSGTARDGQLDGLFAVDGRGNGVVGPVELERNDGASIYARLALERSAGSAAGIVDVHRFSLLGAAFPATLDAALIGGADGGRLDALSGHVAVASPYGSLAGRAISGNGLVGFAGTVRTSFERLRPLTGALPGSGPIDGSLQALTSGTTTALQGAAHLAGGAVTVQGRLAAQGVDLVATTSPLDARMFAGAALPLTGGTVSANVHVHGTLQAPQADIAMLVDRARARGIDASGNAFAHYSGGTLRVNDATVLALGTYATAAGDVRGIGGHTPAVDVGAHVRGAELAPLAHALRLPLRYPDGALDADVRVRGSLDAPQLAGSARIPQGSLNGLDFRDAGVTLSGNAAHLAATGGRATVGTTAIAFAGDASAAAQRISLDAPRVNLADFNDYFDAADTLGGRGHVRFAASRSPRGLQASGDVAIAGARFRRFAVGNVAATLATRGRTLATTAAVRGSSGNVALSADAVLAADDPLHDAPHRTTVAASAAIAGLDLAQWLPAAGITLPVRGTIDASAHAGGTLAAPSFTASAALTGGVVARYPIATLTIAATGNTRSAHLTALQLAGPGLTAAATGTFGYGARDPIAIALHAETADVALLAKSLGVTIDAGGAVTTTVDVSGTRVAPRLTQTIDATNLRTGSYVIPNAHAELAADSQTLQLRAFDAGFAHGRLSATATLPIELTPKPGIRNAPLTATLQARGIDLAQFATLLPQDAKLAGIIDGTISAGGTLADPAVGGSLALSGGSFSSSLVRSAFTNARARIDLARAEVRLSDTHVDIGGGTIDGGLDATFGDLRDLRHTLAFNGSFTAQRAAINLANLFRGTVDGTLDARKAPGALPTLGGTITFTKARIPLAALIPRSSPTTSAPAAPLVAFDMHVVAGNDVRVQGPGVDIGARGAVAVGGTLAAPQLDGNIHSTDGTLSFYRTFVLQQGTVAFQPSDGLIPNVDATATTEIANPDTQILLHVTGPATNLNLDFASNPSYDREQILGLLVDAQALGAVPGVETAATTGSGISASGIAGGLLGNELTQNLLQPVGSDIGQALGFQDLALGYNFGTGVSAGARRQITKNIYATFNQTFGSDQRQSLALNADLSRHGTMALTFFNAGNQSPSLLTTSQLFAPVDPTNFTLEALQPPPGIAGIVLTYQRKFR